MKGEKARLDWREGRRRRAWELKEAGWKQQDIAAALGVTPGAVSQWLSRARQRGVLCPCTLPLLMEAISIYDVFFDRLLSTYCTEGLIGLSVR
jgi:predicted transcriptional regulator